MSGTYSYELNKVGQPSNADCGGPLSTRLNPRQPILNVEIETSEPNLITGRGMRFRVTVCPELRADGTCGRISEPFYCIANVPTSSMDNLRVGATFEYTDRLIF